MSHAYIGYQSILRLNGFDKRTDVAWMAGSHLNDGNLMFRPQAEKSLRHADIVVEIALCKEDVVACGKDGCHKFLCRCLAVGAGNADDRYGKLSAMFTCKKLERRQAIVNKNVPWVATVGIFLFVNDGISAPLL